MAVNGSTGTPAPWEAAPAQEQLFVLITGANSGIGLSIGERLIDEFFATRSLTAHLILIPTTRSATKSRQTIQALRAYAIRASQTSTALASRAGGQGKYNWEDAAARVHILSVQLDLCDIRGIYALAKRLCEDTVSNPDGLEGQDATLRNVRLPRLDSVVFNAAYGGWSGVTYHLAIWKFLTEGLVQSVTWPTFKNALPTCLLNDRPAYKYPAKPQLGEVFCACIFGHYLLAHRLLPLLRRPTSASPVPPGRIIWASSLEAIEDVFNPDDIQAIQSTHPYDSTKRLTDLVSLTYSLPSAKKYRDSFLTLPEDEKVTDKLQPQMYVTHPGIVVSTLFPLPWFLMWAYELVLVISRWIGSPWHTVDPYSGAKSVAWLVLQEQESLDAENAERIKWGSASNHKLENFVKRTEVERWGWKGKVEDVNADEPGVTGVLRKRIGRRRGVLPATKEDIEKFEELGLECWEQMEDLRQEWEEILDLS